MSDDLFLRNRSTIAIITGGTQGLGLAIARRLAMEGAQGVVLSGRRLDKRRESGGQHPISWYGLYFRKG
jgi:NAD(P)-dependent dehydrogenase (short-subunit alcohol dehydrogenase family)